jgi:hypothetical protein
MDAVDVMEQLDYWAETPSSGDMLQILAVMWGWRPQKSASKAAARNASSDQPLRHFA